MGRHRLAARLTLVFDYHRAMKPFDPFERQMSDEALHDYLLLCQEMYLEMERTGHWPWPDSHISEDLLESEDT